MLLEWREVYRAAKDTMEAAQREIRALEAKRAKEPEIAIKKVIRRPKVERDIIVTGKRVEM